MGVEERARGFGTEVGSWAGSSETEDGYLWWFGEKCNSLVWVVLWMSDTTKKSWVWRFATFLKHLKQVLCFKEKKKTERKKANHQHQPLKVHRARLMRNTGLCLWISSRPDSAWPETRERQKSQESNSYLIFFFWLVIHKNNKKTQIALTEKTLKG